MDATTTHLVLWSQLTQEQKDYGIHPNGLGIIQFDGLENAFSEEFTQQLERFFFGCRLAASNSELLSYSVRVFTSNDPKLKPIKEVLHKVLLAKAPKDHTFEQKGEDCHSLRFEDEGYGRPYREYKNKFVMVYNQLINENKSYLMHPARYFDLIQCLQPMFSNVELTAERLINYHCFGQHGLEIFEQRRRLFTFDMEREQILMQFNLLKPCLINPREFHEETLECIPDKVCRKYVCSAYQYLASQNKLHILDLPEERLHKFEENALEITHPDLAFHKACYYNEVSLVDYHFGIVVRYLKALRHSDLSELKKTCLIDKLEHIQRMILGPKKRLFQARIHLQNKQNEYKIIPENYPPGNFSFFADPITSGLLTNAYDAVQRLNAWTFFDIDPPEDKGYMFWDHPTLCNIRHQLSEDGFNGNSLTFTMSWMQSIRKKGWNAAILEDIEETSKELGSLNKFKLSNP